MQDLNRVKCKPSTGAVESDGRPDARVADEAWSVYKKRNDSIVVDLFQGQYRSCLVCPACQKALGTLSLSTTYRFFFIAWFCVGWFCTGFGDVRSVPLFVAAAAVAENVLHRRHLLPRRGPTSPQGLFFGVFFSLISFFVSSRISFCSQVDGGGATVSIGGWLATDGVRVRPVKLG